MSNFAVEVGKRVVLTAVSAVVAFYVVKGLRSLHADDKSADQKVKKVA